MIFISYVTFAQIGIGTINPDASAVLDMTSTSQGVLIPRMTTIQREAVATPVIGLQVYDTDTKSVWSYNGAAWANGTGGPGKFIDGGAPDIAYYEGRVGIGLSTFSTAHKIYVESIRSTDETNTPAVIRAVYDGTGTNVSSYALANTVSNSGTGTIGYAIGTRSTIENSIGGTITAADIIRSEITNSGNMGVVTGSTVAINNLGTMGQIFADYVATFNPLGSTITTGYSSFLDLSNDGTMTTAYGQYVNYRGTGTVTDSYAIYIDAAFNQGTGENFAIYSESDADSYVEGSLGVGVNTPLQKVHISGAMRLEPQGTAPAGTLGDLYVDLNGNLYFNDGSVGTSGWRPVLLGPPVP